MAKKNLFQNKAFEKTASTKTQFHLAPQMSPMGALFENISLEEKEEKIIESILSASVDFGNVTEDQKDKDFLKIKKITAEIKSIGRQGAILMGERVFLAREILKPYRDGTFTKWLEATFSSRKTGYNRLAYFELYKALPQEEIKKLFQEIPQRAAYILASREGDLHTKSELIRNHYHLGHQDLINVIKKIFPATAQEGQHKKQQNRLIATAQEALQKLHLRKEKISGEEKKSLLRIQGLLQKILES